MAALPLEASSTSCPASVSPRASPRRSASWSSAIRMRPIHPQSSTWPPSFKQASGTCDWERNSETRTSVGVVAHVDAAVVGVDDLSHDCQAKTRPLGLGREKRIEDLIGQFRRYSRPVIHDFDDDRGNRRASLLRKSRIHQSN